MKTESADSSSKHFFPDVELAKELLALYGSPLYVYDAEHLRKTARSVSSSVSYKKKKFAFAAVTNGNLNLLRIFRDEAWGLHANTPGDAYLGMNAGFQSDDIVYSGSNLSFEEMTLMLRWGIKTFNLDSLDQLRSLGRARRELKLEAPRLGFRLNLPKITGESRTGISVAELKDAEKLAKDFGLVVSGIHFYRGTSTNATEHFVDSLCAVIEAAESLESWEYLDFGGGFGFPYQDRRHCFDWKLFGDELSQVLAQASRKPELLIEPGRSVIAGSGCLLCEVVSTKWQGEKQLVGVNTTTSNIAVLSVHGGTRQVHAYVDEDEQHQSDVCGNTTYSRDYLARSCSLPSLKTGDVLAILDTGAYGYSMSSHFLHRPRSAEVLLEGNEHRLIRRRESWEALLENQLLLDLKKPITVESEISGAAL